MLNSIIKTEIILFILFMLNCSAIITLNEGGKEQLGFAALGQQTRQLEAKRNEGDDVIFERITILVVFFGRSMTSSAVAFGCAGAL